MESEARDEMRFRERLVQGKTACAILNRMEKSMTSKKDTTRLRRKIVDCIIPAPSIQP